MLQPGDLIRDNGDGDLGLVLSEVRSYNTIEGPNGEYVMVKWALFNSPQKMIMSAISNGWVEVLSEAEETTNR
jgi:hypothetical protein